MICLQGHLFVLKRGRDIKEQRKTTFFKQPSNYERWRLYVVSVDKYGMDM